MAIINQREYKKRKGADDLEYPFYCAYYVTNRCDQNCFHCFAQPGIGIRSPYNTSFTADFDTAMQHVEECHKLGIRWMEPCGGDILRLNWLPEMLRLIKKLGMISSGSLSGRMIDVRLGEGGEKYLSLFDYLRFSLDSGKPEEHNLNRAAGSFEATYRGLEAASRVRQPGTTLIVYTLVPGVNISWDQIGPLLQLAKKTGALLHPNPVWGNPSVGNKERADRAWAALTEEEAEVLSCLKGHPQVTRQGLHKLEILRKSRNDRRNPVCRIAYAVLTIANNRVLVPCYQEKVDILPIPPKGGIEAVLRSREYKKARRKSGKHIFCEDCAISCNLAASEAYGCRYDIPSWEATLFGM